MALSANANYTIKDPRTYAIEAVDAAEIYNGSLLMMGSRSHGTAGVIGRIRAWNDEVGAIPMGFSSRRTTGNTTNQVLAEVDLQARVLSNVAVTGLAGTNADRGRVVYATDDNTFTLTRPTLGHPVGIVVRDRSATNADVYFFDFGTLCAIGFAGAGRHSWLVGIVNGVVSTGNHATGIVAPCHGRILSTYGIVFEPQTDGDATGTINLEIGGTNVTGGVITFATADALGANKAGTAVTGANVFHEGDLIDIECTEGTAGAAADGYMAVYADVLIEPGL